jgi:hypothetical protein
MGILEKIFPRQANNEYRGSPISFYVLCAFAVMFTGRSLIHYFKNDGGANSIASIVTFPGTPDPDSVIYLIFSLWGGQQLITVFILGLVLWRYRSLIPFMFLMIIAEQLLRMGAGALHPLTADFYEHRPPGGILNLPMLTLAFVMFFLSLRETKAKPSA